MRGFSAVVPEPSWSHLVVTGAVATTATGMPDTIDVRVASNGRLILPLAVRQAMGLRGESPLILSSRATRSA